jgi:hypothetical protein
VRFPGQAYIYTTDTFTFSFDLSRGNLIPQPLLLLSLSRANLIPQPLLLKEKGSNYLIF